MTTVYLRLNKNATVKREMNENEIKIEKGYYLCRKRRMIIRSDRDVNVQSDERSSKCVRVLRVGKYGIMAKNHGHDRRLRRERKRTR